MPTIETEGYLTACVTYIENGDINWDKVQQVTGFGSEGGCKNKLAALKKKWKPVFDSALAGTDTEIEEPAGTDAIPSTPKPKKKRSAPKAQDDDEDIEDVEESKGIKKALKTPKSPKTPKTPKTPRAKKAKVEKKAEDHGEATEAVVALEDAEQEA